MDVNTFPSASSTTSLPAARKGARNLAIAFVVLRVMLLVVAGLSAFKICADLETKNRFEINIMTISSLQKSHAELKTAKCDLLQYTMGGNASLLKRAQVRLRNTARLMEQTRTLMRKQNADEARIDEAAALMAKTFQNPLDSAMQERATKGDTIVRKSLATSLLKSGDPVSAPFGYAYADQVELLLSAAETFKQELRDTGLLPIFALIGSYLFLVAGLTRDYLRERKRNEDLLRASETEVKFLLDNMHDGLLILDETLHIEIASARAMQILGYASAPDLPGKAIDAILGNEVRSKIAALHASSFSIAEEATATRRDGNPVPVEILARAVETQSGERMLLTLRDITERKQIEQWKQEMVSVVSHDLRTPLTSMMASFDLVATGALGPLPPDFRHDVTVASSNTHKLVSTINTLLELEKLESTNEPLDLTSVPIASCIQEAVERTAAVARDKSIVVETQPTEISVWADKIRLTLLIEQLLSNAIKFSPAESTVRVTVTAKDVWIDLRVIDRGRGIAERDRERIFQRLEQVDIADRQYGAGLGLSLSRAIASKLGGAIGVDSKLRAGSEFWVLLRPASTASGVTDNVLEAPNTVSTLMGALKDS